MRREMRKVPNGTGELGSLILARGGVVEDVPGNRGDHFCVCRVEGSD